MKPCALCGEPTHNKKFCSTVCANKHKGSLVAAESKKQGKTKVCITCKQEKHERFFSYNVKYRLEFGRKPQCKACGRAEMERRRRDRGWEHEAAKVLLYGSRQRAKRAGLENTLNLEDIKIPDKCPVFGFPLKREKRSDTWVTAPSIDRIDNTKGYTPDNIVIVSRRANILKKDATSDELRALADFYSKLGSPNG